MSQEIKCSEDNPCQHCKEWTKQQLAKCESWEIKKKQLLESFNFDVLWYSGCPDRNDENIVKYSWDSRGYSFKFCPKCSKTLGKSNNHGDTEQTSCTCQKDNNNPTERANLLNYFTENKIQSITLENNKLIIKYQDKEEEKEINTQELQLIQSYCQQKGLTSLSLEQLQQNNQQSNKPTNWTPYVLGGVGIVVVIIGLVWLVRGNNKKENKE